jgi:hypothetical protein
MLGLPLRFLPPERQRRLTVDPAGAPEQSDAPTRILSTRACSASACRGFIGLFWLTGRSFNRALDEAGPPTTVD